LASLRGEDPPPIPDSLKQQQQPADASMSNPHGGMDMGGGDTGAGSNPHGGMDMSGGGGGTMPNPHGGGEVKPDGDA